MHLVLEGLKFGQIQPQMNNNIHCVITYLTNTEQKGRHSMKYPYFLYRNKACK